MLLAVVADPRLEQREAAICQAEKRGTRGRGRLAPEHACAMLEEEKIHQPRDLPELEVELKGVSPWQSAVRIATRYRRGRVFLAGDAAHAMPPWGGFGANTGIQDAHNLAWKLAAVLRGEAGAELLATYEDERLPVARAVVAIAGSMNDERGLMTIRPGLGMLWKMRRVFPYLLLGYGYASSAVVFESQGRRTPAPGTTDLDGRPGTRAPHVWLVDDGKRISSLDLFGRCFHLLAGPESERWCEAAREASARLDYHVHTHRVGVDLEDPAGAFLAAYRLKRDGAVLVRPDGFVAWRSRRGPARSEDPAAILTSTLRTILARAEPASRAVQSAAISRS